MSYKREPNVAVVQHDALGTLYIAWTKRGDV
jgi:hypothetical protein